MQFFGVEVFTAALAGAACLLGAGFIFFRRKIRPGISNIAMVFLLAELIWSAGMALHQAGVKPLAESDRLPELAAVGLVILARDILILDGAHPGVPEWGAELDRRRSDLVRNCRSHRFGRREFTADIFFER